MNLDLKKHKIRKMDNVSGDGNWTVDDKVITKEIKSIVKEKKEHIEIDNSALTELISKVNEAYEQVPNKELYDTIINLSLANKSLENYEIKNV